ncbi:radical SAM family heme chaperone HemW [Pseudaestuariivita atlantica]|uniref:Heme chaperone HemW n=1 Tax=Pseudaestuariivita atlantica TaxID=1317121 RepID=A0A0L1JPK4_9RHOB|nr:radical SAM family heme chaperone HemW [Pseudaestuariivita atlantica]KNG93694.1 coproporphyrinogen III oxidase [Pseudaestuariivita atlantica]
MAEDWQNGGFGLYVHWPYCEAKCPYCDFNSHVARWIDHDRWTSAYKAEIARVRDEIGPRLLNSIYIGGGTPSLMQPETVATVIEAATTAWTPANDIEITLEANPGSVERARFAAFAEAGVNRVSMGIQALNDPDLHKLGRIHGRDDALRAFDIARDVFDRVSFDLIYARQDQSKAAWEDELSEALSMAVDHLSLYQLTIESGTAFGDRHARGGLKGLPDEDLSADMFEATQATCAAHGFPAYEVSNHAKPGAESRHNGIYWRYGDYAGIGPGAHGRITRDGTRYATVEPKSPAKWLDAASSGRSMRSTDALTMQEQADEMMLMGMRLYSGVSVSRFASLSPDPLELTKVRGLVDDGLLILDKDRIAATPAGMQVLNHILRRLLAR